MLANILIADCVIIAPLFNQLTKMFVCSTCQHVFISFGQEVAKFGNHSPQSS